MKRPASVEDLYPLSLMQRGMHFEQRTWVFHGALDVPAFRWVWEEKVNHHPILRSVLSWVGTRSPPSVPVSSRA